MIFSGAAHKYGKRINCYKRHLGSLYLYLIVGMDPNHPCSNTMKVFTAQLPAPKILLCSRPWHTEFTVDERNPVPIDIHIQTLQIIWYICNILWFNYQLVQDFFPVPCSFGCILMIHSEMSNHFGLENTGIGPVQKIHPSPTQQLSSVCAVCEVILNRTFTCSSQN